MPGIQEAAIEGFERVMAPAEEGQESIAPVESAPVLSPAATRN